MTEGQITLPSITIPNGVSDFNYLVDAFSLEGDSTVFAKRGLDHILVSPVEKKVPFYKNKVTIRIDNQFKYTDLAILGPNISLFLQLAERSALMAASEYTPKKFILSIHTGDSFPHNTQMEQHDGIRLDILAPIQKVRWIFSLTSFGERVIRIVENNDLVIPYALGFLENRNLDTIKEVPVNLEEIYL